MKPFASPLHLFAAFFAAVLLLASATVVHAGIATVTQDIQTSFATYHPIPVTVTPQARQYTIAPDLGNVSNIGRFNFTPAQKALLAKNGFVAVKSDAHLNEMVDIYKDCSYRQIPVFITTDLMLHVLHKEYDAILKGLEKKKFLGQVTNITTQSLAAALSDYAAATSATARNALKCNAAYFAVAASLLEAAPPSLPAEVKSLADAELALVNAHSSMKMSPLFIGEQDYTQFIVRGHYVGDPDLERYFRAMMWYGTMRFTFKSGMDPINDADLRRMALQALLLARGVRASADWNAVYQATSFLVGRSEGVTLLDIDRIAAGIYGAGYATLSPDALAAPILFDRFFAGVQGLSPAKINPQWGVYGTFMGQRYIPDSYIMSLTADAESGRLPRGLDVMAVLGSARAEEILKNLLRSPAPNLDTLRATFNAYPAASWVQNVYWNWLYCLVPVLEPKGAGYPPYMQSLAWRDKDLAAALGSWAELRHDVILYGQGTYLTSVADLPLPQGGVEANPSAFARLAALCQYLRDGLANLELISAQDVSLRKGVMDTLDETRLMALMLKALAEKELANKPLSNGEYLYIQQLGNQVERLLINQAGSLGLDYDTDMGVIADVATYSGICQEEAVGRPLNLFVIIDTAGDLHLARGAAFSYYEFTQPIAQRLTDPQWRAMLDGSAPPSLPAWMDSYFDHSTSSVFDSRYDQNGLLKYHAMDLSFAPNPVGVDQKLLIKAAFPEDYIIPHSAVAQITPPGEQTTVSLTLTQSPYHSNIFTGTISTQGWHAGTCSITCKGLTFYGQTVLTHSSSLEILPYPVKNASRPDLWRRFE